MAHRFPPCFNRMISILLPSLHHHHHKHHIHHHHHHHHHKHYHHHYIHDDEDESRGRRLQWRPYCVGHSKAAHTSDVVAGLCDREAMEMAGKSVSSSPFSFDYQGQLREVMEMAGKSASSSALSSDHQVQSREVAEMARKSASPSPLSSNHQGQSREATEMAGKSASSPFSFYHQGQLREAMEMARKSTSTSPFSANSYALLLKNCSGAKALANGKCIHACLLSFNARLECNLFLGNAITNMYAQCGNLRYARAFFDRMFECDVFSWNAIIVAYTRHGQGEDALKLFWRMQLEDVKPNRVTFTYIIRACTNALWVKRVHQCIRRSGFESDVFVGSALVAMYSKCGSVEDAHRVFSQMPERDVVTWSAMIDGYARHKHGKEALELLEKMGFEGVEPNWVTFTSVLKAFTGPGDLERGKRVHARIKQCGFEPDALLGTALIGMYAKCGSVEDARYVFDGLHQQDSISWSTMIAVYTHHKHGKQAVSLFWRMQREGIEPDPGTLSCVLEACASWGSLDQGKQVHACIEKYGFRVDVVLGSALVDMYAKCGRLPEAQLVFGRMRRRNVISWSVLIAGYAQHRHEEEALALFEEMQEEGVKPDEVAFACILRVCAGLGALEQGRRIHDCIRKSGDGFESKELVRHALVDMYAKCGSLGDAWHVFDQTCQQSVVLWNTMINGYAQHGHGKEATTLFEKMWQSGVEPDETTFVSILSACSHKGLESEARHIFHSMSQEHGITATIEHYSCIVDLLARLGHLAEAEEVIDKMPIQPTFGMWMSLLGACKVHGNKELGRRALKYAMELGPKDTSFEVLSDMFFVEGN